MIDEQTLLVWCALAARCFGMAVCLPFGESMQQLPRLCVALAWGWSLAGRVSVEAELSALSCVWEFAVGALLAAPLRLLSDSAELFGELLDTARGQTVSAVIDPLGGQSSSDLAAICRAAAVAVAIHLGALEFTLRELAASYELFPLGAPWLGIEGARDLLRWSISILSAVLGVSGLWLAGFLMVDIVVAAAARLVRGVQFSSLGSIAKGLVTFALLAALLGVVCEVPPLSVAKGGRFLGWHLPTSGGQG